MLRTGLVVFFLALLAAGCGGSARGHNAGSPAPPRALFRHWATEASDVAVAAQAGHGCHAQEIAQSLSEQVAAQSGRVPARFRTPLLASVAALAGRIACVQIEKPKPKPKHGPPPKPKKPKKHDHGPGGGPGDHGDGG